MNRIEVMRDNVILNEVDNIASTSINNDTLTIEFKDSYSKPIVLVNNVYKNIIINILENVMINNFFDGPGDQVPYVPLKDKLYESYPNTWVGAGIDEYGVLLNRTEWARVAITPFMRYASMNELQNRIDRCSSLSDEDFLFTCITKEYWNNPLYRKAMIETLEKEGKDTTGLLIDQLPAGYPEDYTFEI